MSLRPFLCHARQDQALLTEFKRELSVHGADGWQDVESLGAGAPTEPEIRKVIQQEAGGFLVLLTPNVLTSWFICEIEVPEALRRAAAETAFPVMPIFHSVTPSALANTSLADLGGYNGVLRRDWASDGECWTHAAAKYVRSAVVASGAAPIQVGITCTGPPRRENDLTIDWSELVSPTRTLTDSNLQRARQALINLRDAFHGARVDQVAISPALFLPLAVLVGYEWNTVSGLRLSVRQRSVVGTTTVGTELLSCPPVCTPTSQRLLGSGPAVIAVSSGGSLSDAAMRYAQSVSASELFSFEAPEMLSEAQIGGLAAQVARELSRLRDAGREKHLVIKGPVSLAVLIGAAGNAMGRTTVPVWDQDGAYLPGPVVGAGQVGLQPSFP